mmetsp:Transcript_8525/g.20531  ORF Transcript_8525/g.20531 Transcript_8525/m.20531 type:complete len:275 (+) Transcript_8525:580-1404(+)
MHDQVNGLVIFGRELSLGVLLMLTQTSGLKSDITGLVDTVDISKGGSNGEHVSDLRKFLVDGVDLFGRSVELFGVDVFVVDTVFFSSSDTDFHFHPNLHLGHALEIFLANGNVFFIRLFGKIKHVAREERLAVLGKVCLAGIQHGVHPRQQFLGAVISVKNDWDSIVLGDRTDVKGTGHGSSGSSVGVGDGLSSIEFTSTVGELKNDGGVAVLGSLQSSVASRRTGTVESWNGISVFTGMSQQLENIVSGDNTNWNVAGSHDMISITLTWNERK